MKKENSNLGGTRIIALFLVVILCMAMFNVSALATGLDGFGEILNSNSGTVIVDVTGDEKEIGYITVRIYSPNQNEKVYFCLTRPNNGQTTEWRHISPKNGEEQKFIFTTAMPGEYRVSFYSEFGSSIDFLCWIYG